jgi:hypothetical protein
LEMEACKRHGFENAWNLRSCHWLILKPLQRHVGSGGAVGGNTITVG